MSTRRSLWCRVRRRLAHAAPVALVLLARGAFRAAAQETRVQTAAFVLQFTPEAVANVSNLPAVLRQPITIDLEHATVEQVLREIAAQAKIDLAYSRAVVPLARTISVHVTDGTVAEALRQALRDVPVELWVSTRGKMALVPIMADDANRHAPPGTITGRVTSTESGEPLLSAAVSLVGTRLGALTDADGRYTIPDVPEGTYWVRVQRLGFAPDSQRVTVPADRTVTVDFVLHALAVQLGEVVSIGYGTAARRDLTGAISSVSADQVSSSPTPSVDQAIEGRVPGVQVVTASGQPGTGAMVRIRGGNSITAGNDPLYVIDGVPVTTDLDEATTHTLLSQGMVGLNPVAALNPEDIQSIEILKDASASAIYGARAANGVVLITTKHGRSGQHTVSGSIYYGIQDVRRKLPVLGAPQFAQMVNEAYTNAGQTPPFSDADIANMGPGTDWQDAIFRKGPVSNYQVSVSGGDDNTQYYISGAALQSDGIVIGTGLTRRSFRLNLDQNLGSKFRVGNQLTFSRSDGQVLPNAGAGQEVPSVVLNAVMAPPTLPVRDPTTKDYFVGFNSLTGRLFSNPVASALDITNEERQNRVIGNLFAEYDITKTITLRSTFGLDYLNSLQDFYSPVNTLPGRNNGGQGSRGQAQTTSWLNENTIHYRPALTGRYVVDLLGGVTLQRINTDQVSGSAQGFNNDNLRQNGLNNAQTFVGVWTGDPHSSLFSSFARANLGISDRYLFTVTGRVDGSSRFGAGNRYGIFPSAAFAWRASDEGFVRRLGVFDDLKMRVSWGRTGNQEIGNYAALATLGGTNYVFGGIRSPGFAPSTLANPDLKWESTAQLDLGLDAAFLKSRVAITADFYDKKTSDLLLDVPVPASSGFGSSVQNIGSVRNRGFELSINTVNLTGAFGWESSLNLAWNRNKVLNLGRDSIIIGPAGVGAGANQNPTVLKVGEPINSFYGWVYSGMQDGQPVYKDLTGDGVINDADRTIIGNAQPDYTGGFTNQFTYRGFELSVFLQWSVGNQIYNINRALLTSAAGNANQLADVMAGGRGIPTPKIGNAFDSHPSDLFVESGTYLRGKNIRLAYTLPGAWLRNARLGSMTRVQLYVSAQNFFTSTKYSGFDPEISEYAGTNLAQGFDFGTYPQPRQITFGLNAGF